MEERVSKTPFGTVNASVLGRLRESFETQRLLEAVDRVDRVAELVTESTFRRDLVRLHGMAQTIINGAPTTASSREAIWELAGALALELEEPAEDLQSILGLLHELAALAPEEVGESGAGDIEGEDF